MNSEKKRPGKKVKRIILYISVLALFAGLLRGGIANSPAEQAKLISPAPVLLRPFNKMVLDSDRNVVADSTFSLDLFYRRLGELKTAAVNDGSQVVSILHLGDSHIQAGFLTGTLMRNFHRDFGNAGRGLITPLKIAKTNEPTDYVIRSNRPWESSKLVQANRPLPLGLGGVAIGIREPKFSLTIGALEKDPSEDYSYNKVRILKYPGAPELDVDDERLNPLARHIAEDNPYVSTVVINEPVSELKFSGQAPPNKRDSSIYYGFVLENSRNGVLYHSVGINGAQFLHWTRVQDLTEQMKALAPDLVVLSMGTNESLMGASFSRERFRGQIDSVVVRLRQSNPDATFLLTTPPDSYMRRRVNRQTVYVPNPLVESASAVIREYAAENGLACWDLFSISGGKGSCEMWKDEGLFSRDQLHFTVEGYQVLANYLYHAIVKGYNQYVRDHYGEPAPDPEI